MKTILLLIKNKNIADNISKIKSKNYNVLCLRDEKYLLHYVEEYLPSYIILSSNIRNFREITDYINSKTNCELIITGISSKKELYSKFKNIFVGEVNEIKDLKRILNIIDKLESEKPLLKEDKIRYINQQVISFYSVQGGVGKTSLVFNLAWFLKSLNMIRILIVDLNFCEGPSDLSINLNLSLSPNLSFYIEKISDGPEALYRSVVNLQNSNIDILQPPLSIYQSDKFTVDMLNNLLYLARNNYNFVIADIPFRYNNTSLEMLNLSTISILVLSPNIGSILRVNDLQKFLPSNQKKGLIVNQVRNGGAKSLKEIKAMLNIPIYEQIPYLPKEKRKYIRNGNQFFNIVDFQSNISKLARFFI